MKILKLLNSKYFSIICLTLLLAFNLQAEEEPADIWNVDEKQIEDIPKNDQLKNQNNSEENISKFSVFDMQSNNQSDMVQIDESLKSKDFQIIGLYDPEDYDLKIDMWSNSNGDQLKSIFNNLLKLDLSSDASSLMNIVMLTNAYTPKINIKENEFLDIKSQWLIKHNNRELIEEYLIKNNIINIHTKLSRYIVDQNLSESNIDKACELFSKNTEVIIDDYLSKFNLYCLVYQGRIEEAQLILDLKKELGFRDDYFENKLNFLFGFTDQVEPTISEKTILDFHLAHKTNPQFIFEPKKNTGKLIWKYLSTSNLLVDIDDVEINDLNKISLLEKATHDKNYPEDDLFSLYKKFQFNINQLLNAIDAHKILTNIEARALIYQRILIESDQQKKLEFIKILKELFIKDNFSNAFDNELNKFLQKIDLVNVPSNLTSFYYKYLNSDQKTERQMKFNKDILHQSKLINYFNGDYAKSKIEKDLNNFLKKIKNNKKYIISKKDIILIESLKSDGIEISKKYQNLYSIDQSEMPTDIQVMINNNELGATILRIVEIIGQDKLESLDEDTLFFIVSALNQLDIDYIRNKILLDILPLKI